MSGARPLWDRGEPIDAAMMCFTVGDDWLQDRRLVAHDLRGSQAHASGLLHAGLLEPEQHDSIQEGLAWLLEEHAAGRFTVEAGDEDVHSAVERALHERIGEPALRLHLGRSRNEQVALDLLLWLREEAVALDAALVALGASFERCAAAHGSLPLPGYTHLRRAMPSMVGDWVAAHATAVARAREELAASRARARFCPLGSGAGYGVPLPIDRAFVAERLGFEAPAEPVTSVQHGRGRAELAHLTVLEGVALDLGKLAQDLWLFSSAEFGFAALPAELTTGSSLMPHKRNPDVLELMRAQGRQVVSDRAALLDVVRDLPSGYHRDYQLLKPPLFRAADRVAALLDMSVRVMDGLQWNRAALQRVLEDEQLQATHRLLEEARDGAAFREAYRRHARAPSSDQASSTSSSG